MRAYLLGMLSAGEASALEEEYFVNRAVFLKIQSEETALIADYLNGSLRPREKQSFEQRYLEIPALRSKVEAARREHAAVRRSVRPKFSLTWQLSFAVALVLIVVLGFWIYQARPRSQQNSATQTHPAPQIQPTVKDAFATIYLYPGITKGGGSRSQEFQQPAAGSFLNLVLALPGQSAPKERTVQIFKVAADDSRTLVWWKKLMPSSFFTKEIVVGNPRPQRSQILNLAIPAAVLPPGDYIIHSSTAGNQTREIYECRVLPRENSDQK